MNKIIMWIGVVILALSLLGGGAYILVEQSVSGGFTPIFCNDYSFTCCVDKTDSNPVNLDSKTSYQCPENANYCLITSTNSNFIWAGSEDCELGWHPSKALFGSTFACDDERVISENEQLLPSEHIYGFATLGVDQLTVTIEKHVNGLIFTGRSGYDLGVPVLGADGCTFNPTATRNDGKLVEYDVDKTSYTISPSDCMLSFVPGDRHMCGTLEEQCSNYNDCSTHSYGNYECIGRTLQEYGCKQIAKPWFLEEYGGSLSFKPFSVVDEKAELNKLPSNSRCEIITGETVQCCGDTDCGSNAFCDVGKTWTCQESAECDSDSDCGVSQQCDRDSKTIKKPVCNLQSGKCEKESIKDVECCSTEDCPDKYFCGIDNTCQESTVPKVDCPFSCCVGELNYFNKGCADGTFCVNHICTDDKCTKDSDCQNGYTCDDGDCVKDELPGQCNWYEEYYEEESCGFWCSIGVGDPVTDTGCKSMLWQYVLIIGGVIIAIVLIIQPKKPESLPSLPLPNKK